MPDRRLGLSAVLPAGLLDTTPMLAVCGWLLAAGLGWAWWRARRQARAQAELAAATGTAAARERAHLTAEQELLRASESRANGLFELGLVALADMDADSNLLRCNEEFAVGLGRSAETLAGRLLLDQVVPEERATVAAAIEAVAAGARERHQDLVRMRRSDGSTITVNLGLRRVGCGDDGAAHLVVAYVDMTEIMVLIDRLQEAKEEADAALAAKTDFLANVSHEVRTPMTAMLGYADLAEQEERDPAAVTRAFEAIRRHGRHLLAMLDDVIDLSQLEAGRCVIQARRFVLTELLDDVLAQGRVGATQKGLALELASVGRVPVYVHGDPMRLRQILQSLVANAIKFTAAGTVRLVAELRGADQPVLCLHVQDTGVGMSEAQCRALFRPFAQVDNSSTRRHGGLGIGLAIAKGVAQKLGAELSVRSRPGVGSTFTLALAPAAVRGAEFVDSLPAARAAARATAPPGAAGNEAKARILIAEDGADNQRLLRAILAKAGHAVTVVADGAEACRAIDDAIARGEPFDLVVMDMQMPVLDGYDAVAELRRRAVLVPVVACTAHALPEDRERCLAAGCTEYTTKPIDRRDLLEKVARCLTAASA
ncbi:MAG: response regulator [Planctomycetes bacterium]|nr:response regulator [Planctomycetota bacterium]